MADTSLPSSAVPDLLVGVNAVLRENSTEAHTSAHNNESGNYLNQLNITSGSQNLNVASTESQYPTLMPRLQLKLPALSSSSSDSEADMLNGNAGSTTDGNGDRPSSPPPNCAICLSRCKNKCLTDSCMHQFCFKCLCEWSKVKPECPLCKQTFKSIIHNVKSIDQFEEYHVQSRTVDIPTPQFELESFGLVSYVDRYVIVPPPRFPRGRSTVTVTSGASGSRGSGSSFGAARTTRPYPGDFLDEYYRRNPDEIGDAALSHMWRIYIYDRKLFALPVCDITGRFRESSARFYRENPAQMHRLMPFIRRDIHCLLDVTASNAFDSIAEALTVMNILSPAFRRRVQPFLGAKTAHFIHELNNFARSPYDMIGYDRAVRYSIQIQEEIIEYSVSESSDGDDNLLIDATTRNRSAGNAINLSMHDRASSSNGVRNESIIELVDESDNNDPSTSTSSREQPQHQLQSNQCANVNTPSIAAENIELSSTSSDECEFVLERKPPHLRTPEMVSLHSASDSDVVFVDETKPLNKTSFNTSDEDTNLANKNSSGHNKQSNTSEASKRQSPNSENTEMFNVGASTSAGLRFSGQDLGQVASNRMSKRNLRKTAQRKKYMSYSQSCDKRLDSDSYSPTSSTSTSSTSSTSTETSTDGLSISSTDAEFHPTELRRSQRNRKYCRGNAQKRAIVTRKAKRGSRKRRRSYDTSSDDDETYPRRGKNFALVMALGQKYNKKGRQHLRSENSEENDAENSWRLKAVNEPLRKKQQQQVRNSLKRAAERSSSRHSHTSKSDANQEKNHKKMRLVKDESKDVKNEIASDNDDDGDDDDDDIDNLNLSTLKSILKGEKANNTNQENDTASQLNTLQATERDVSANSISREIYGVETTILEDNVDIALDSVHREACVVTSTITSVTVDVVPEAAVTTVMRTASGSDHSSSDEDGDEEEYTSNSVPPATVNILSTTTESQQFNITADFPDNSSDSSTFLTDSSDSSTTATESNDGRDYDSA
uniref:E3 ubiquitin-protein ligase Topors n=1 Tax=Glossina palpalis gambiensis TaxID=67801 RepID=A0A1B0B6G0_9MUSC